MNITLYGNRVPTDDQVKMRSLGWTLIQYEWYPYKEGKFGLKTDIHRGQTRGDTGRRWLSTSQGTPKAVRTSGRGLE